MAFMSALPLRPPRSSWAHERVCKRKVTSLQMEMKQSEVPKVSRRKLLIAGMGAVMGGVPLLRGEQAGAADDIKGAISRFFFPKAGFNVRDTELTKGRIVVDQETLQREDVKKALGRLRGLRKGLKDIRSDFQQDPSKSDVQARIKKDFEIEKLRADLNSINEVFDEDTQRRTDKLVRGIIQDVGEVEMAASLRGGPRTPKKIERTKDWLDTFEQDFDKLLGFYD